MRKENIALWLKQLNTSQETVLLPLPQSSYAMLGNSNSHTGCDQKTNQQSILCPTDANCRSLESRKVEQIQNDSSFDTAS